MQLLVKTRGTLTPVEVTDYSEYGTLLSIWRYKELEVFLYGKTIGKKLNKYDFPPLSTGDKPLYGRCLLVNPHGILTVELWTELYEGIMQFEDIYTDSSASEDEPVEHTTRQGYEKDGFVVSDSEEII